MITNILSRSKLKQLFLEIFINKTDKATDVSDNSVTNAVAFGVATVAQKALKDIAIVESQLMPDTAIGQYLDNAATLYGVSSRKNSFRSSTYVTLIAEPGTFYDSSVVSFTNYNGIRFIPEEDLTISDIGFGYISVRSEDGGQKTNVDPNSIVIINSEPVGHISLTNEYISIGGLDSETDEIFRQRIKKHNNIVSKYTLEYYNQVFQQFNSNILKIINLGNDNDGKRVLAIATQNGITLSESELDELLDNTKEYFSITDLNRFGEAIGIKLVNIDYYIVGDPNGDGSGTGIDFRVQLWNGYSPDTVRKNIQIAISKYLDFRFWKIGQKIEWDNLLQIVKSVEGVRYVPDGFFNPHADEIVPINKLPRVRKFIMRDLSGTLISDSGNIISPIFYPNEFINE